MAGETDDCITLQAERLPTGSISFGRFELETLSWERRSSFSHNRYLEEVVKCATPGSVTQKRAILEAHFNKKPLLPQASLENQSTAECQASENDLDHHASCSSEFENRDDGQQPEFVWYDETPTGSDGHDVVESEQTGTWSSEFPIESTPCNDKRVVDSTYEQSDHDEILEQQPENDSTRSNKDDLCVVSEQELDNKAVIIEESLENKETVIVEELSEKKEAIIVEELKSDVSHKIPAVEKKRVPTLKKTQKAPVKVKEEKKTAKTKQMDQLPVQQNLRKLSTEKVYVSSGKMLSRSMGKLERESTLRAKLVKQLPSPSRAPMATSSDSKDLKLEGSVNMKAKVRQVNRREKETTAKKSSITPNSFSGRSEPDVCRPVSRPGRVADSAKEETKQSGAIFNFKSDERAEKRKEYYMKLEEKLHAKEVEMNAIQARTQEETEAGLKQLRRSLNFKATPMPSFYHGTAPRASEGKKKVATPARPQKLQGKCPSTGSRTYPREKLPSFSEASNRESPSSDEPNLASWSANPCENGKKDNRSKLVGNNTRKKGDIVNRLRRSGVGNVMTGGIAGGNVAVHVAS